LKFLDKNAVAKLLPYEQLINQLESAFRSNISVPKRMHEVVPVPGGVNGTLLIMPAWKHGGYLGVKIATVFPNNSQRSLPSVQATYALLEATTGKPLAMMDGAELTARRTAAASALASRYLSRPDANTLLMVGTGTLALHLIKAHASVRPIERVLVWGRRPEAAASVCRRLRGLELTCEVANSVEVAMAKADIVSCATLATSPLVHGEWLHAGQHLDLVGAFRPGMTEADGEVLRRADVYVDSRAGAMFEGGEVAQALSEGRMTPDEIKGDLFELARGGARGRQSASSITVFKSVGTAVEDLAAAELAFESWLQRKN